MAAFRMLLIKPILDNVLSAEASPDQVLLFHCPAYESDASICNGWCRATFTMRGQWWRGAGGLGGCEVGVRLSGDAAGELRRGSA